MDASTLQDAIAEVCPVISTSVGKEDDRSTWSFVPNEGATTEQVLAGENVIATIPIDVLGRLATSEFISRWMNAEYRALQDRRMSDNGKLGKDWDNITSDPVIDLNKKKVQTLKSNLVADGILTQARADEIFS